jgi:hypothetical protein
VRSWFQSFEKEKKKQEEKEEKNTRLPGHQPQLPGEDKQEEQVVST